MAPNSIISIARTKSRRVSNNERQTAFLPFPREDWIEESPSRFDRRICRISFREAIAVFATRGTRAHSHFSLHSGRKERPINRDFRPFPLIAQSGQMYEAALAW